jgi:membrane-bound inhibitor of C-type lysozyme
MIQKRFAFFALAGMLAVSACDSADQAEVVVVEDDVPAMTTMEGVENPHTGAAGAMSGAARSMPGEDGVIELTFNCAGEKAFQFVMLTESEQARITIDGETYELEKVPSASGMKYSDGTWTFFGKGPEAIVAKNDEHVLTECKAAGHS